MLWPWFSVYSAVNCAVINLVILSLSVTSGFMIDPKTEQCLLESVAYSLLSNQLLLIVGALFCSSHYLRWGPYSNKGSHCRAPMPSVTFMLPISTRSAKIFFRSPDPRPQS